MEMFSDCLRLVDCRELWLRPNLIVQNKEENRKFFEYFESVMFCCETWSIRYVGTKIIIQCSVYLKRHKTRTRSSPAVAVSSEPGVLNNELIPKSSKCMAPKLYGIFC